MSNVSRRAVLAAPLFVPAYLRLASASSVMQPKGKDQTQALQAALDDDANAGLVQLGPGTFRIGTLHITRPVTLLGVPGRTVLASDADTPILAASPMQSLVLQGFGLANSTRKGDLVYAEGVQQLTVEDCSFDGGATGLRMAQCGGRVAGNVLRGQQKAGIYSLEAMALDISGNSVSDQGNAGIQVHRGNKGEDGSRVINNLVQRVAAEDGGDGPNGNGINIFAAHGVTVANNRVTDCAFSGIRNASSDACIISANNIARCNEVALYVEFEFLGAVVADNIIETASHGISITNFMQGGRLAQCSGNVLRNLRGLDAHGRPLGGGIAAEADTLIANNVVENADTYGIGLGWGEYARDLSAIGNILRDCTQGIRFSARGPGPYVIAQNLISGASQGAILGMDHENPATADLSVAGAQVPDSVTLTGNRVKN